MKVKFLTSPTGTHKLAFNAGDEVNLPDPLAKKVIADGIAEQVDNAKLQGKTAAKRAQKAVSTKAAKAEKR